MTLILVTKLCLVMQSQKLCFSYADQQLAGSPNANSMTLILVTKRLLLVTKLCLVMRSQKLCFSYADRQLAGSPNANSMTLPYTFPRQTLTIHFRMCLLA